MRGLKKTTRLLPTRSSHHLLLMLMSIVQSVCQYRFISCLRLHGPLHENLRIHWLRLRLEVRSIAKSRITFHTFLLKTQCRMSKNRQIIDSENQGWLTMISRIHHVVNHFRQAILGLPTPSYPEVKSPLARFNIPHTYLWSSGLLPKPADWEENIGKGPSKNSSKITSQVILIYPILDIAGYISSKTNTPNIQVEEKLEQFLQSAENPLLVLLDVTQLNDPEQFLDSLKEASLRYGIYLILPKEFRIIGNLPDLPTIFVINDTPAGKPCSITTNPLQQWHFIAKLTSACVIEHIISRVSVLLTSGSVPAINLAIEHKKPVLSIPLLREYETPTL